MLAVALLLARGIGWAVPPGFNAQFRLTDAQGLNRDGTGFSIKFTIFDAATGGAALWTKTFSNLTVRNGNFQVIVGDPSDTPGQTLPAAFSGESRFLEIQVLSGPGVPSQEAPMSPRQQLVSVPYAMRADVAKTVEQPSGWRIVQTQNPSLATTIRFTGLKPGRHYRLTYRLAKGGNPSRLLQRINDDARLSYTITNFSNNSQGGGGSAGGSSQGTCYFTVAQSMPGAGIAGTYLYTTLPGKGSTVMIRGDGVELSSGADLNQYRVGCYYTGDADFTSLTVYDEGNETFSGTFHLEEFVVP